MLCVSEAGASRFDRIPMYGQPEISRSKALKRADEAFIAEASAGFGGDRAAASRAWYAEAERFFRERDFDSAMQRYNQAWLLDQENYQPFWGFARVAVQDDRLKEALQHFETSIELCGDEYQKVALLSDAAMVNAYAGEFQRANSLFAESTAMDPNYDRSWYRWSQSLFLEGNYPEAWVKLRRAEALGANVSDAYLRDLRKKLPEPE